MSTPRLSIADIERFAYGEADELEATILGDEEYLAVLEDIWQSELPRDLREPVVRAIQLERFVSGTLGLALDTAIGMGEGTLHYLAAAADDVDDTTSGDSEPDL